MKVNDSKTQMLCMSPSVHKCKSYLITNDGTRIESSESLKLLGFHFDEQPSPHAQVEAMVSKFRRRLWSLRYLKKSGMVSVDLCHAYTTYLRPVLEYGSIPIHSLLSQEQSDLIDRQQSRALKLIYGFDKTTTEVLALTGLDPLSLRRSKAVDRFALKLVDSPRYGHWFPELPPERSRSRNSKKYMETYAKTSRLYNSPIFYMRRRLNELADIPNARSRVRPRDPSPRCDFIYDEWR